MGKKKAKGTQKVVPVMDAGIESPSYETDFAMSNTEKLKRSKQSKNIALHICKCKNKKTDNVYKPTVTWESITNVYGDADKMEVWDNEKHRPNFFSKKPKATIDESEDDVIIYPTSNLKPRRKKHHNKIKIRQHVNENSEDTDVKYSPYNDSKRIFTLNKKPKKGQTDNYGLGDICTRRQCREAFDYLYNLYGLKYNPYTKDKVTKSGNNDKSKKRREKNEANTKENKIIKKSKYKQATEDKIRKEGNVGYGDQISQDQDSKVQCTCSFIGKMMRHINKFKNNVGRTLQTSSNVHNTSRDPLLEMKVNLTDMRVINSPEVNEKIRKLGRIEKKMSCICPSRKKRLNGELCERGICERALKNRHTHFNCKCQKQNNMLVECNDSTCDLKIRDIKVTPKQKKIRKSPVYNEDNKPLFEVMLDATNMNVINEDEIKDIIGKKALNKIICPTGICEKMSKQRNVHLNCKCVGKKLTPGVNECDESTCRNGTKNRSGQKNRNRWPVRGYGYDTNHKRDDNNVKTHRHYKRNGSLHLPRGQTMKEENYVGGKRSDLWYKCFCECNRKQPKKRSLILRKINKKIFRSKWRRKFYRKKKNDHRTRKKKFSDCTDREECKKKVKKKTKEYKKNEKKAIKENKKMVEKQNQIYKERQHHWSCLTNFFSGFLNVAFESVKKAFVVTYTLIVDPISCYVYVREKLKNPPAAINRICEWFVRTWKNKLSGIANVVEGSTTLNVISDHIENTALYNALAQTGKTPTERMMYERRSKMRRKRIQKRHDEAIHGCQHILLMTLRKTPCLWFYHVCPNFYPQCLSLLTFMNSFLHVILYCGAAICWTPCILACEICRAFVCCFLCTH